MNSFGTQALRITLDGRPNPIRTAALEDGGARSGYAE